MRKARSGRWGRLQSSATWATGGLLAVAVLASGSLVQAAPQPGGIARQNGQRSLVAASSQRTAPGVISTVAGGVGGPGRATAVDVSYPCGVSFGAGALYIAGGQTVRRVNPATDWLTTPAGTDAISPVGDGGPATSANVETCGASADHDGNLLIANFEDQRIQVVAATSGTFYGQVMTAGHIYTVAGDGARGTAGDGGPATKAGLNSPEGVAVDAAGNLVIADTRNRRIQVVAATSGTFYGQAMSAGDVYTVATLGDPAMVALDHAGNVVISSTDATRVFVLAVSTGTFYGRAMTAGNLYAVAGGGSHDPGNGGPARSAALQGPTGVAVDPAGNLVIGDTFDERVRVVAVMSGTFYGQPMTAGDIYTVAGDGGQGYFGDGGSGTSAWVGLPMGVGWTARAMC